MNIREKVCALALASLVTTLPAYAQVVTGSQEDGNLSLKYPLVYTDNEAAQASINGDIATYVLAAKDDYYNKHIYKVSQSYKVTYEDDQVVSILLTTSHYHMGAAHSLYSTRGLVYNKVTGQRIPLYNYIKIASAEQLEQGLRAGVLGFYSGNHQPARLLPSWSVKYASDNYCLRGKGYIDLVYQPYELGPFAYGNTFIAFSPSAIEYFNRMNG